MWQNGILLIALLCSLNLLQAQIGTVSAKYNLDTSLNESSGLLYFNNRLISMNDSGNLPRLYEMDTISNQIIRTVNITNANNTDWEALTQDDTYIYIGDFGNNLGDRTDLKIYRVIKTDYLAGNQVTADIINFTYNNQTSFVSDTDTDFDAEAMIVKGNYLFIFSKNHGDQRCNLYQVSKIPGSHSAVLIGNYDTLGMITDATYDATAEQIFLTGYNDQFQPFVIRLSGYTGNDFFSGSVDRIPILNQGTQIEAIANVNSTRFFMTSEEFNYGSVNIPAKLFAFNSSTTNAIDENKTPDIQIYPNPTNGKFSIALPKQTIGEIIITNISGQIILHQYFNRRQVLRFELPENIYFLQITTPENIINSKLIVK